VKLVIVPLALAELHDAGAFSAAKGNVDLGLAFVGKSQVTSRCPLAMRVAHTACQGRLQ
jgi:hypothetical protein